jgi:hypothetical protein
MCFQNRSEFTANSIHKFNIDFPTSPTYIVPLNPIEINRNNVWKLLACNNNLFSLRTVVEKTRTCEGRSREYTSRRIEISFENLNRTTWSIDGTLIHVKNHYTRIPRRCACPTDIDTPIITAFNLYSQKIGLGQVSRVCTSCTRSGVSMSSTASLSLSCIPLITSAVRYSKLLVTKFIRPAQW